MRGVSLGLLCVHWHLDLFEVADALVQGGGGHVGGGHSRLFMCDTMHTHIAHLFCLALVNVLEWALNA